MNDYIDILKKYCQLSSFDSNFPLHLCAGVENGAIITASGMWIYYEDDRQLLRGQEHFLKRLYIRKKPVIPSDQDSQGSGKLYDLSLISGTLTNPDPLSSHRELYNQSRPIK